MKSLSIDIETYAGLSLADVGQYRYAEAKDFEILLFAYSVDNGEVKVIDIACGESIPDEIISALTDESVIKWAFNAVFERVCISRYLRDIEILAAGEMLPAEQWRCSSVWSGYLGYPQSLAGVGEALNLEDQKMSEGKDLIELFCHPHTEGKTRILPSDEPEKWEVFKAYNRRDVEVELKVKEKLSHTPVPENLWEEYWLEQRINDRGVTVDTAFVKQAILTGEKIVRKTEEFFKKSTGMDISCSGEELHEWIAGQKEEAEDRKNGKLHSRVIEAWSHYRKCSVDKYKSLLDMVCEDGKIHGSFRYYSERRNGYFSSRIGRYLTSPPLDARLPGNIREIVKQGNERFLRRLENVSPYQIFSYLLPTAFVPEYQKKFRVIKMEDDAEVKVFMGLTGVKESPENIEKYKELMKKLKPAVEKPFDGEMQLLTECINSAPEVMDFYRCICTSVEAVVRDRVSLGKYGLKFSLENNMLAIELPTGRKMYYAEPEISEDITGQPAVHAKGCSTSRTEWKKEYLITAAVILDIIKGITRDNLYKLMAENNNVVMHTKYSIYIDRPVQIAEVSK